MSAIVLFDGVCNLCDKSVRFIFCHDPSGYFKFAPLQSQTAQKLLADAGASAPDLNSILLIEDGKVYSHSTAALRIARRLKAPFPLLWAGMILPRPLRDIVYKVIAKNRYKWFGQKESCELPPKDLRERFLAS
ncbi:thiol-disulfide oxidoreductase DCC family protein [Armatimonas sp.]|uniref:thiol-disulfide oxidoreductase DCC family protein n=1 Tax=Armatimonas sp. TaxID=1872638 RepID=UPI003752BA8A